MNIVAPKLCQGVELEFHPEIVAKILGSLVEGLKEKSILSGLMVKKDFGYSVLSVEDLSSYTPLASASLIQRVTVPFNQSYEILRHFMQQLYQLDDTTEVFPLNVFISIFRLKFLYQYLIQQLLLNNSMKLK